jgi:urease accessory protein
MTTDWLLWQLADSAFPTGGFAHSFGLEAAWQQGEVNAASLASFLRNPVANRASRVQGRAWLGTIERSFPRADVRSFCGAARARLIARHYAPLAGAALHTLGVDRQTAARLFLFGVCRGTLSAAVRLGIVGTTDAQRLLAERTGELDRTLASSLTRTVDEAAQTSPLADLWQASHDRLYSRLFQS